MPAPDDGDLRMTYCAFIICALLDHWTCIDLPCAISYIYRCRMRTPPPLPIDSARVVQTYEGGYGQTPHGESLRCRSVPPRTSARTATSTARQMARNGTMARADAAQGWFCGTHVQAARRVLRVLVRHRALFLYASPFYRLVDPQRGRIARCTCPRCVSCAMSVQIGRDRQCERDIVAYVLADVMYRSLSVVS
jgi:hypothetical protein